MKCPECKAQTWVVKSRWSIRKQAVRRLRQCPRCKIRVKTLEILEFPGETGHQCPVMLGRPV